MLLSTQPYRGTRDFYPSDFAKRQYIFDTWRHTLKALGYEEYDTPVLEEAALYLAKSGEELGGQQLYHFWDKGQRHLALRPEMTPSLARMVANKYGQLRFPLRWFSIPNCWRYERPQKGRLREFWQLNVDIIGLEAGAVDLEFLYISAELFRAFGASPEQFEIKFNHRQALEAWVGTQGLQQHQAIIYKVLDDWYKTDTDQKIHSLQTAGLTDEQIRAVLHINQDTTYHQLALEIPEMRLILEQVHLSCPGVNFVFEPTVVRGLAYYTGLVIEAYDRNRGNPRALFGGGRYDDLMSLFDDKKTMPAIGLGWGDVTMTAFLDNWHLWPENLQQNPNKVGILPTSQADLPKIYTEILPQLRKQGRPFEIDYDYDRSPNKRYQALKKRGCSEIIQV